MAGAFNNRIYLTSHFNMCFGVFLSKIELVIEEEVIGNQGVLEFRSDFHSLFKFFLNLFNYATDDTLKIDLGQEFFYDSCKVDGKNLFLYLHQSDDNRTIINKVVKRVVLKS